MMKKKLLFLILLLSLIFINYSYSQGRFSANVSNASNVLTFSIKPDITTSAGFSTVEFFLRYPTSTPAFNYGTVTVNTTNFPGMTSSGTMGSGAWEIERNNPIYVLPGYNTDHFIYTAPAPISTVSSYTGGVSYDMISVPLTGGTNTGNFQFISQEPDEQYYYLAITGELGNDLRPISPANYFYPVTSTSPGPSGSTFYYEDLLNVPLPIKLTNFSVIKKDKDAALTWIAENQDNNSSHFDLERSFTGTDFTKIGSVNVNLNNGAAASYSYTDIDIAAIKPNGIVYYRLKIIDKDGKFTYSDIRSIKFTSKSFGVNLYPNPARNFTRISLQLEKATQVMLNVTDAAGKIVQKIEFAGYKGLNQKTIDLSKFASGSYLVKVNTSNELQTLSLVKE